MIYINKIINFYLLIHSIKSNPIKIIPIKATIIPGVLNNKITNDFTNLKQLKALHLQL